MLVRGQAAGSKRMRDVIAVHLPQLQCAGIALQQDVALAVIIEVADAFDVPVTCERAHIVLDQDLIAAAGAVELPDLHQPAAVAQQQVADAVAVEVADADDMVAGGKRAQAGRMQKLRAAGMAVELPQLQRPGIALDHDIADAVVVEVAEPCDLPTRRQRRTDHGL